jgi:hypothetical protein
MLSTSLSDLAGTALLPAGSAGILPGTWGAARPSFWCQQVANETVGATSFLLHEEHATRFREEYPECVGARLLAAGGKRGSGAKARRLVVVAAPLGAIQGGKRKKGAGAERFENERCVLSEDGWSYLRARGGHCNLLVWSLDFHCAGIDTFLCVADTNILSEPARGSCIGSISPGETVLASGARQVPSKGSWVRIGLAELVPGKVYAVRAGVAPACILRLDLENERELIEDHGDDHKAKLLKPLHDLICKPTLDVLRASQNARDRPTTKHYLQDFTRTPPFCTCPDHTKRGGAHDACKHVKAGQKRHILSSFPLV